MRLPTNRIESLRLLRDTALGGLALTLVSIILGNVIRVRAQYAPGVVQLDQEDGKDVMEVSYIRMLKRVIKLEGWKGLVRGISLYCATMLSPLFFRTHFWNRTVPLTVVTTVMVILWCPPRGCTVVPFHPVLNTITHYCLSVLFNVPFTVLFVRSITTPVMLPFFDIHRAIRTFLSPAERHRPWLLYFTPGLLLAIALERAWDIILIPVLAKLITRHTPEGWFVFGVTVQSLARLALVLLYTAICGPLGVIKVRLAVQRHEQPIVLPDSQHDDSGAGDITESAEPLDTVAARVVRLRTDSEQPAYTGLFNCVRSIITEEGFERLYRAWWFTLLAVCSAITWR